MTNALRDEDPISVVLLENIGSARQLYTSWLERAGFVVSGVRTIDLLKGEAQRSQPRVALIDVDLERKDDIKGLGAAAVVRSVSPDTVLAVFTGLGEDFLKEHLPRVLGYTDELPAEELFDGVLLKDMSMEEIAAGIRQLADNGAFIAPDALRYTKPGRSRLNARERQAIQALCRGLNRTELERELHMSAKTVQRTLKRAKEKLGVQGGDAELVKEAYARRIVSG